MGQEGCLFIVKDNRTLGWWKQERERIVQAILFQSILNSASRIVFLNINFHDAIFIAQMILRVPYFLPVFLEPSPLPTPTPTTQFMAFLLSPEFMLCFLESQYLTGSLRSRSSPNAMFIFPPCCPAGLCFKLARPSLLPPFSSLCSRPYLSMVFPFIQTCLAKLFQQWPVPSMPFVV